MTTRPALVAGLALAASMLASCTTPAPEPTATADAPEAAELCAAWADVETIVINAGSAFRDGRTKEQEYQGWLRIATRALSRIEADESTTLGAAIANAQAVAPATPIGQVGDPFDPLSTDWGNASASVRDACEAEGYPPVGEGFTGG
jgi:hypothetical protein